MAERGAGQAASQARRCTCRLLRPGRRERETPICSAPRPPCATSFTSKPLAMPAVHIECGSSTRRGGLYRCPSVCLPVCLSSLSAALRLARVRVQCLPAVRAPLPAACGLCGPVLFRGPHPGRGESRPRPRSSSVLSAAAFGALQGGTCAHLFFSALSRLLLCCLLCVCTAGCQYPTTATASPTTLARGGSQTHLTFDVSIRRCNCQMR